MNLITIVQKNDKKIRVKEVACKNLVKTDKTKNKLSKIELKNKIEIDNNVTKSAKESDINGIGIESQALLYYQKFVEATKTNHMGGKVKSSHEHRLGIEKKALIDIRETF
ncbi:hypothetical protein F8M41_024744 [Gigaspora margarita]|uniref:Uncharacterized protein n=1 Tax=Gigaspora margarita TaxID=4874 RepID=A0A8H4ABJ2_GIGMA|nr:hypothetical protein F8M41_024744 [Gigaspora margarita]